MEISNNNNLLKQNRISKRQLIRLLVILVPGGKLLSMPGYLASIAGRNSYLSVLLLFIADFACMLLILLAVRLNTQNKSIFEICERCLTKVGARILFSFFIVYFMLRITNLAVSSSIVYLSSVNVKANWLGYAIPFGVLMLVFLRFGFNSIARVTELLFFVLLICITAIIVFSVGRAEFSNLLPFLEFGTKPIFSAASAGTFWFADEIFLIFLIDAIMPDKKSLVPPLSAAFWSGAAIAVAIDVIYLALFDALAGQTSTALSKISQFTVYLSVDGRLDWLTVGIWLVSIMLKMSAFMFCAYSSLNYIVGYKKSNLNYLSAIALLIPLIVLPIFYDFGNAFVRFVDRTAVKYGAWALQYLVPALLPLMTFIANKSKPESEIQTAAGGARQGVPDEVKNEQIV